MWMLSFPNAESAFEPWTGLDSERDVFDAIETTATDHLTETYFMDDHEVKMEVAKAFSVLWPCSIAQTVDVAGVKFKLVCTD